MRTPIDYRWKAPAAGSPEGWRPVAQPQARTVQSPAAALEPQARAAHSAAAAVALAVGAGSRAAEVVKAAPSGTLDPLAVMKAVHAAGGVSVVRPGVTATDERFSAALAAALRKGPVTPTFLAALEKVRAKAGR